MSPEITLELIPLLTDVDETIEASPVDDAKVRDQFSTVRASLEGLHENFIAAGIVSEINKLLGATGSTIHNAAERIGQERRG